MSVTQHNIVTIERVRQEMRTVGARVVTYTLCSATGYTPGLLYDIPHPAGAYLVRIIACGGGGGGASGEVTEPGVVARGGTGGTPGVLATVDVLMSTLADTVLRCAFGAAGVGGAASSGVANNGTRGGESYARDDVLEIFAGYAHSGLGQGAGSPHVNAGAHGSELPIPVLVSANGSGLAPANGPYGPLAQGGCGGGVSAANAWSVGGHAGRTYAATTCATAGLPSVTPGVAGLTEGANGTDAIPHPANIFRPGSAGGGGASSTVGNGGSGGNGANYGGPGGGGGAARTGNLSGKGGNGSEGFLQLIYFCNAV